MPVSQAVLELLVQMKDEVSSTASSISGTLGTLGTVAGGVALAGVAALGAAIWEGSQAAIESRQLMAATEQTIASMGNAAGVSAEHVADFAASLSDASGKSLFGDDQIQQASNLLLTFGEIKGETLDLATALTVDLAQALGGAPADQAMMLGKALNDPIKGITALGKAGLTFSEEQKAMIASLVETGDMAGAQAIIIEELNKQVGGQAEAAATAAGGMVQFQAGIGEAFETIGSRLLPVLDRLGAWLNSPEVQQALSVFAENLANGITIAANFLIDDLIPALTELWNWLSPILGPVLEEFGTMLTEDLPMGIALVVQGWNLLEQALSDFKTGYIDPIVRGWNEVTAAVENAYKWFADIGNQLSSIQVPDWLQGHSPPPMANWLNDIAGAAENAQGSAGGLGFGADAGALPTIGAGAGGIGGGQPIVVNVTVQGSVTTERDLVQAIRQGLISIGVNNVDIFGGVA